MDYGVTMFPTDYSIRPDDLARMLEDRGFESYWAPEHTHIPTSRRSPWPGGPELPEMYWHTYDPFVALTAAAMATKRLKVATGICLVIELGDLSRLRAYILAAIAWLIPQRSVPEETHRWTTA